MITEVSLVNWKSHLNSKLQFSQGVNALIGINGSGKSSVLDAISFALFGTFPSLKARRLGIDDLIMKKPDKKEYCTVEVKFTIDGRQYSVKRIIERDNGSQAEMKRGSERIQNGPELVTTEVVRVLQMDYDLFSKAVYSEQNGMDYFLRVQKGRRMEEIDRMLKVDKFEDVRAGAVSIANRIKSASEERMKVIADIEAEDYDSKLKAVKEEIALMEIEKKTLAFELASAMKDKAKLEQQVVSMEEAELEFSDAKFKLESLKSSQAEAQESLERRKQRLDGRNVTSLEKEIKDLDKETRELTKWISESEEALQVKKQEIADLNSRIKMENESAESLQKLGAKCPVCESQISEDKKKSLCSKHRDEAILLRSKVNKVAGEAGKISEEIESMSEKLLMKERDLTKLSAMDSDIEEVLSLEKKISEYNKQMQVLREKIQKLSTKYDRDKISALRKELRRVSETEAGVSSKLEMFSRRIEDKMESAKEFQARLVMLEKYKKESEQASVAIQGMKEFEKALKLTQEQLRSEFLKTVNVIINDIWKFLYPYRDFRGIRLSAEDDYSLELKEPGGWVGADSVSGGERSIAALALRIAFSRAFLPKLRWLILDEPTHNLDANAISQFSEILREKMSLFAEQVFLITHEERISEGVTGSLYRLERDKENDGVTKIVEM